MTNTNTTTITSRLDDIRTACELVESEAVDTIITAERLHPIVDSEITDESIGVLKYSARTLLRSLSIVLDQNRVIADLIKDIEPASVLFGRSRTPQVALWTVSEISEHQKTVFANVEDALSMVSLMDGEEHNELTLKLAKAWAALQLMECALKHASHCQASTSAAKEAQS
jgi:c-di-GMP-related signal transduction protein